jgi:hypothetical protein
VLGKVGQALFGREQERDQGSGKKLSDGHGNENCQDSQDCG